MSDTVAYIDDDPDIHRTVALLRNRMPKGTPKAELLAAARARVEYQHAHDAATEAQARHAQPWRYGSTTVEALAVARSSEDRARTCVVRTEARLLSAARLAQVTRARAPIVRRAVRIRQVGHARAPRSHRVAKPTSTAADGDPEPEPPKRGADVLVTCERRADPERRRALVDLLVEILPLGGAR